MYALIRPLLFRLPPEVAHALVLRLLAMQRGVPAGARSSGAAEVMGLGFPNRLGLAAGFDKNGVAAGGCAKLGFGFVEVGTVTPRPQAGQPQPRVFRLVDQHALINRMGFPNAGTGVVAARLQARPADIVIGVNIGKNADTPVDRALHDYLTALRAVHQVADYIAVNLSSPNTPGLRQLQGDAHLEPLLSGILQERDRLDALHATCTPLVVKISPDEDDTVLRGMTRTFLRLGVDGVIATNTTLSRSGVESHRHAAQSGGLSGAPLQTHSLRVVSELRAMLGNRMAIIGVGGIDSVEAALAMRAAGADLVQLYTALVYKGPALVRRISGAL